MANRMSPTPSTLLFSAFIVCYLSGSIVSLCAADFPDYYYPDSTVSTNGIVRAVLFSGGYLYVGGNFTRVTDKNGTYNRTDLAAYDTATWLVTDFTANTNSGLVRSIVAGNGKLYVGGTFTQINRVTRSKVAALDPITGAVITGFGKNDDDIDGTVQALAVSDTALYIGGNFTTVDGYPRSYLAALDAENGLLDQQFDPSPSNPFDDSGRTPGGIYALEMHPDNPRILFAGGNFLTVAGLTNRPYLVALNADGTPGPVFQGLGSRHYPVLDLDAQGSFCYAAIGGWGNRVMSFRIDAEPYVRQWSSVWVNGDVQAIAYARQGYVYFGCHDGVLDSMGDNRLAVLDATNGKIYDIYPEMNSFFGVRALDMTDNCLAVGGEFTEMNGITQRYLAVFSKFPFTLDSIFPPATPVLYNPTDSLIVTTLTPNLEYFAGHAETYEVQVASDPQFSNLVYTRSGLTANSRRVSSGLKNATEYWWRVRAFNSVGVSDWSAARLFITFPGRNDVPVPAFPANNALLQPLTVVCAWHPTATARSYHILVSETPDFLGPFFDQTGITDTSVTVTGLANATTYYWGVCALTIGGETDWSSVWKFTTVSRPSEVPFLAQPIDGAIGQPVELSICWHPVTTAQSYGMQFSTTPDFNPALIDQSGIFDTCFALSSLAHTTAYYWRVKVIAANGEGDWSAAWRFNTAPGQEDIPEIVFPADGATDLPTTLALQWHPRASALSYCLRLTDVAGNQTTLFDLTGIIDTSFTVAGLDNNGLYQWQINALTLGGYTGWASAGFRTIVGAPRGPRCIAPFDNASQLKLQQTLRWENVENAASYRVQVSTDSTFMTTLYDTSGLFDTSFVVLNLTEDTRYFWRVNCSNSAGEAWSSLMRFRTMYPLPGVPLPVAPATGYVLTCDSLHLIWKKSAPYVTKYRVEIAHDNAMRSPLIDSIIADTEFVHLHLDDKTSYLWRVSAYNESGWSGPSEIRSYEAVFPPDIFFMDKAVFSDKRGVVIYRIAQKSDVRLELFDLRGKSIGKILRTNLAPGVYRDQFPIRKFPVGTYLLVFKAGRFSQTEYLTLMH
jgi:hypothetical protein